MLAYINRWYVCFVGVMLNEVNGNEPIHTVDACSLYDLLNDCVTLEQ